LFFFIKKLQRPNVPINFNSIQQYIQTFHLSQFEISTSIESFLYYTIVQKDSSTGAFLPPNHWKLSDLEYYIELADNNGRKLIGHLLLSRLEKKKL
jgi:hypothetical protein